MNLILFPESASLKNGYGIAVAQGYDLLAPNSNDLIIWYTNSKDLPKFKENDIILARPKLINAKRIKNMLLNKLGSEVTFSDLSFLKGQSFDNIHCDDVVFYRAIRRIFPQKQLNIRFHNCFARILDRKELLGLKLARFFELKLRAYTKLEREIFRDKQTHKIFISKEDKNYYTSMTGCSDASVWSFNVDMAIALKNRLTIRFKNELVWVGGVQDHKMGSMIWFLNEVLPKIRTKIPNIEFHLWGMNTIKFNNPSLNIFGHGFYAGENIPLKETALFINPDIIGGGVKLKLKSYFESGAPFITTPFGFEGYSNEMIDGKYCIVSEMSDWADTIISLLNF